MFAHQLNRNRSDWKSLVRSLRALDRMRTAAPEPVVRAVLNESSSGLAGEQRTLYDQLAKNRAWKRQGMEPLRLAVRMQALELSYHELGGLFDRLAEAGHVDPVVVRPADVDRAVHQPPAGGRAEARGKAIERFEGKAWSCDWQYAVSQAGESWIDLRDPFASKSEVTAVPAGFFG